MGREDGIRAIAYKIWEEEGCIEGHDCEHWLRAEVVWEQQQNKVVGEQESKSRPRKAAKRNTEATAAKKRTQKK